MIVYIFVYVLAYGNLEAYGSSISEIFPWLFFSYYEFFRRIRGTQVFNSEINKNKQALPETQNNSIYRTELNSSVRS